MVKAPLLREAQYCGILSLPNTGILPTQTIRTLPEKSVSSIFSELTLEKTSITRLILDLLILIISRENFRIRFIKGFGSVCLSG